MGHPGTSAGTLSELLLRRSQESPNAPAVVEAKRPSGRAGAGAPDAAALTAGQLAAAVARLAAALVDAGLEPGGRVVICAAKSLETVVAIHAAQWAGGVAVPLDPASPATAEMVIADVEPAVVVLDRSTRRRLTTLAPPAAEPAGNAPAGLEPARADVAGLDVAGPGPVVVTIGDETWKRWESAAPIEPVQRIGSDPAYILFTSGSTGVPKGIVHSHRSALRYAELAAQTYEIDAGDRLASIAPLHFDQSTFELYASIVGGASVILVPNALLAFPAELLDVVVEHQATCWYSVPTLLIQILERGGIERYTSSSTALDTMRWVLFGGEVFPAEKLAALMDAFPQARFSNVYGPTEVNQCTFHHLSDRPAAGASIPIGRAWGDTRVRLVDDAGVVLDGATTGLLEVETSTMMLGYWRRPELTSAGIRSEVDAAGIERRWYRTGDRVRRDADDVLHFLGRQDRQVKVRGVRIELEGVEAVLSAAPGVGRAAAVVAETDAGQRLIAIVEPAGADEVPDPAAVKLAARASLSAAAVPDDVIVIDRLPRTATGKVDARAAASLIDISSGNAVARSRQSLETTS